MEYRVTAEIIILYAHLDYHTTKDPNRQTK